MKTMNCKQLGGACEKEFTAATFEEIAEMSKQHGTELFEKGDIAHIEAMDKMQKKMQTPSAMHKWFEEKRKAFEAL